MVSCPICGNSDFNIGKSCKKYGQTVCIECCKACEHYIFDDVYIMHRCSYGVKEGEKIKDEIAETRNKIVELDKKQKDLYRRGYPRKAINIEWEIKELKNKLRRLESA